MGLSGCFSSRITCWATFLISAAAFASSGETLSSASAGRAQIPSASVSTPTAIARFMLDPLGVIPDVLLLRAQRSTAFPRAGQLPGRRSCGRRAEHADENNQCQPGAYEGQNVLHNVRDHRWNQQLPQAHSDQEHATDR